MNSLSKYYPGMQEYVDKSEKENYDICKKKLVFCSLHCSNTISKEVMIKSMQ